MYLLQSAGELLQTIEVKYACMLYIANTLLLLRSLQYINNQKFCHDFVGEQEKVYDALVASNHDSIEAVLSCLKYRKDWSRYKNYPTVFRTHPCVDYNDGKCRFYTSLYRTVTTTRYYNNTASLVD